MNCSPVRNGATAKIVTIVSEVLSNRYDVKSVCIDDYNVFLCKGCRSCHSTAECFQQTHPQDDVLKVISEYEWENKYAHKSYVVKHEGVVYHFYCAVNHNGERFIAVATSEKI